MFGKERLRDQLRATALLPAAEILEELLAELERFQDGEPSRDDVTAVVLKAV
jgi:sigma-B regulation protein RsbU (phosphoserine phosphatase)